MHNVCIMYATRVYLPTYDSLANTMQTALQLLISYISAASLSTIKPYLLNGDWEGTGRLARHHSDLHKTVGHKGLVAGDQSVDGRLIVSTSLGEATLLPYEWEYEAVVSTSRGTLQRRLRMVETHGWSFHPLFHCHWWRTLLWNWHQ